ncbi:PI-PLC X domain-containing protein 1-like [Argiope bruennichi]|nr:PI-PLC X domain-containing protein 1-like [Argiope bruennichi]
MLLYCFGFFIYFNFVQIAQSNHIINSEQDCYSNSPMAVRVFLTVSSLTASTTTKGVVKRHLEVNWVAPLPIRSDRIHIYRVDPVRDPTAIPILSLEPIDYPGGYYKTDIELSVHTRNLRVSSKYTCLGYWATYKRISGEMVTSTCLRTQPKWMSESAYHLAGLQLSEIMIPGSHDSGSFFYRQEREPFSKYKYAQEVSIFNQLVYGLRYFDLRVGHYGDKFYINHNFLRTEHTVKSILHEVHKFLSLSPKEIIILDFHNFPHGFHNDKIHQKLQKLIVSVLGSHLIPFTDEFENATIGDLWEHKKNILLSYDSDTRNSFFPGVFWPSIPRAWGNKQTAEGLKEYFREFFEKPTPQGLWASMAEITPNTKSIILHPVSGLRVLAEKINRNITHWFRDLYWQKANIVATDYFLGNDIIDVAIRTNRIKGICPESAWSNMTP